MIVIVGLISSSSVLANAYHIFDEKVEKCVPCEVEEESEGKPAGKGARKKIGAKKGRGK